MSKIDKKLAAKIKAAPAKLLKAAITGLSSFLTSSKPPGKAISMGKSKEDAGVNFLNSINSVIEAGNAAEMPADVIDFYNKYFVDAEESKEEPADKEEEKKAAAAAAKKAKKEAAAKKKKTVERDSFNFIKGSNHSKLAILLSKTPTKMGDVKKTMGNTYYSLMAKNAKVFAKDAAGNWYVIGSPAEKLITSQKDVDAANAKVDAAKKEKKDAAAAKKKDAADKKKADDKEKKDTAAAKKKEAAAAAATKKDEAGKKKKKKKK